MHPFQSLSVPAGRLAVHWFGQSSFAFKAPDGTTVLVDPYFPHERPKTDFVHAEVPLREADLRVDGVILTHNHLDHTHPEALQRIHAAWPKATYVGPHESAANCKASGIPPALFTTVEAGATGRVGSLKVHWVYSKPPQGDPARGIKPPDVTHLGVVIEAGPVRAYVTGDPINSFAELDELIEPVRKLAPQVGFLTNHPNEGEFPFFAGSAKMAQAIGLKIAYPAHYSCFCARDYDPKEWAKAFVGNGVETRIMPYNSHALLP